MKNQWFALAYLLGLVSEMAFYMVGAVYFGKGLNLWLLSSFDWIMVTIPLSLLLCLIAGVRFFRFLIKNGQEKTKQDY